jgi:hypothetical protein
MLSTTTTHDEGNAISIISRLVTNSHMSKLSAWNMTSAVEELNFDH